MLKCEINLVSGKYCKTKSDFISKAGVLYIVGKIDYQDWLAAISNNPCNKKCDGSTICDHERDNSINCTFTLVPPVIKIQLRASSFNWNLTIHGSPCSVHKHFIGDAVNHRRQNPVAKLLSEPLSIKILCFLCTT